MSVCICSIRVFSCLSLTLSVSPSLYSPPPAVCHSLFYSRTPDPYCWLVISRVYTDLYFCFYFVKKLITFPKPATSLSQRFVKSRHALLFDLEFSLSPSDLFAHLISCDQTMILLVFDEVNLDLLLFYLSY